MGPSFPLFCPLVLGIGILVVVTSVAFLAAPRFWGHHARRAKNRLLRTMVSIVPSEPVVVVPSAALVIGPPVPIVVEPSSNAPIVVGPTPTTMEPLLVVGPPPRLSVS